mgnify:CR=1 FL=1
MHYLIINLAYWRALPLNVLWLFSLQGSWVLELNIGWQTYLHITCVNQNCNFQFIVWWTSKVWLQSQIWFPTIERVVKSEFFLSDKMDKTFWTYGILHGPVCTGCPISLDPFCIVTYYIRWVKTSWTYCAVCIQGHEVYLMSKKSCPFVYSEYTMKIGQHFSDTTYPPLKQS